MTWALEKHQKKPKLRLTHTEAVDTMKQIEPFIEHARKAGLKGMGWHPQCGICGAAPLAAGAQETINIAMLMGQEIKKLADWMYDGGLSPETPKETVRKWFYRHRVHVLAAFWAYGLGSRVGLDGHWLSYPKEGTAQQRQEWYRGRFQYLAFQAQQDKNLREERNCLKEAAMCDRAIVVLEEQEAGRRGMKGALDVPAEQEARLAEAEARLKGRLIDHRPVLVVGERNVAIEMPE